MHIYKLIPHDTKIDFVGHRFYTFAISIIAILICALALFFRGVNYGVDFRGGLAIEIRSEKEIDIGQLRSQLGELNLGEVALQQFGSDRDVLIRVPNSSDETREQHVIVDQIKKVLGDNVEYRRIETIGPKVGSELVENATYAVVISLIAILLYIWFRFEWQFAICGIIALANDIVMLLGLYGLFHYFEFNINAIVALLTTASYSIHDSVVVFDRVRENLRKYGNITIRDVLNRSMNETLSRTILTSFTSIISLAVLCVFGGKVIFDFCFPILFGIMFGTFSSICLSGPLLIYTGIKFDGRVIPLGLEADNK